MPPLKPLDYNVTSVGQVEAGLIELEKTINPIE